MDTLYLALLGIFGGIAAVIGVLTLLCCCCLRSCIRRSQANTTATSAPQPQQQQQPQALNQQQYFSGQAHYIGQPQPQVVGYYPYQHQQPQQPHVYPPYQHAHHLPPNDAPPPAYQNAISNDVVTMIPSHGIYGGSGVLPPPPPTQPSSSVAINIDAHGHGHAAHNNNNNDGIPMGEVVKGTFAAPPAGHGHLQPVAIAIDTNKPQPLLPVPVASSSIPQSQPHPLAPDNNDGVDDIPMGALVQPSAAAPSFVAVEKS